MKAALVTGMILIGVRVITLAYFSSPIRILMLAYVPHIDTAGDRGRMRRAWA